MTRLMLVLCLTAAVHGQSPSAETTTLQALLSKVHQLRLALERSNQIGPSIQIAVERIKLQHERVAGAARQLEGLRHEMDNRHEVQSILQQRLQSLENQTNAEVDPNRRRNFEEASKSTKLEAERAEKLLQQMQAREGELAGQLQSEQSRLTELNDRLERIERGLNVP